MHEVVISPLPVQTIILDLPSVIPLGSGQVPCTNALAMAIAPTVTGVRHATVSVVRAIAQAVSYAAVPVGAPGQSSVVTAVVTGASAGALPPAVTTVRNATVTTLLATATGAAYMPILGGGTSGTGIAALATATANARIPTFTGGAVVNAVPATAFGLASPVIALGAVPDTAVAPVASASASAPTPVVTGGAVTVNAVTAKATSSAISPVIPSAPVTVPAVKSGATSLVVAPIIKSETVLTGGGPATANAIAIPPVIGGVTAPPVFISVGSDASIPPAFPHNADFTAPAGITGSITEVVLVSLLVGNDSTVITPPTGFVEAPGSPVVGPTNSARIYWGHPILGDSTYTFTFDSLNNIAGGCTLFRGCVSFGNPIEGAVGAVDADASNANTPAVSTIANGTNRLAVWTVVDPTNGGSGTTFTGGFTERWDRAVVSQATLPILNAGPVPSSGTLVATAGNVSQALAWIGLLIPDVGGGGGSTGGSALPAALPFQI